MNGHTVVYKKVDKKLQINTKPQINTNTQKSLV